METNALTDGDTEGIAEGEEEEGVVTTGFFLPLGTRDFPCFKYSFIKSVDQLLHSVHLTSTEQTTSLKCQQSVCLSYL